MYILTSNVCYKSVRQYKESKEYKNWLKENMQDEVKATMQSISSRGTSV